MKHERYIVSEEEIALLDRYEGILNQKDNQYRYDIFDRETLIQFCLLKDRCNDMYFRRYQAAKEVIDMIAKKVGIDPENTGFWLYAPDEDGTSPMLKRIDEWLSRSGEKAKIKRRVQELEEENRILRSLIQK